MRQLLRHESPEWEKRLLQPDEEQPEAENREYEAHNEAAYLPDRLPNHEQLEEDNEQHDRQNVCQRRQDGLQPGPYQIHAMMLP